MNFYKHHIGDYAQATAHLSFIEDAAYSRMIRKYYAEERPLPIDVKAVQRLVGARTKEEKQAVDDVLGEFFTLEEDGWHNKRCDAEIERANAQAETNRQIAVQRENRRKERRALNEKSTNREVSNNESSNESLHESLRSREPSQTPDTRHQTKTSGLTHTEVADPVPLETGADSACDSPSPTPQGEICRALKGEGIPTSNPSHPTLLALIKAGATVAEFQGAARDAKAKGKLDFAYVVGIVKKRREEAAALVLHKGAMPTAGPPPVSSRQQRIDNYAAQAAAARGEQDAHGNRAGGAAQERDITGESVRVG